MTSTVMTADVRPKLFGEMCAFGQILMALPTASVSEPAYVHQEKPIISTGLVRVSGESVTD